jgi:hypothetical protein
MNNKTNTTAVVTNELESRLEQLDAEILRAERLIAGLREDKDAVLKVLAMYGGASPQVTTIIKASTGFDEKKSDKKKDVLRKFFEDHPYETFSKGEIKRMLNGVGKELNIGKALRLLKKDGVIELIGSRATAKWKLKQSVNEKAPA